MYLCVQESRTIHESFSDSYPFGWKETTNWNQFAFKSAICVSHNKHEVQRNCRVYFTDTKGKLLTTGGLIALCGVTAASLRHLHLLNFKHIELGFSKPLVHWTWLKYPKDSSFLWGRTGKAQQWDGAGSSQWGGGRHEQMYSPPRSLLGWLGVTWAQWLRVLMFCRALDLELDTRHVLGCSLQGTAVFQMVFVTNSQSLPSCFKKLLQLRSFWREIY